ncbi:MAG: hypothetical protein PUH29_04140, partial [Lachnospiraceae bacterium]|nr:hypothetical protein [Lachnospiraceae bacterium]
FCVLRPLKNMERRYTQKLEKEKTAMRENKKKMETLPEMQEKNEESQARLSSLSENFFPEMTSMEIEKMFTRLSLDQGATVLDIDIVMPVEGEDAVLKDYSKILEEAENDKTGEDDEEKAEKEDLFRGLSRAQVTLSIQGSRAHLQEVMDACQKQEPKMKVDEILWQKNTEEQTTEYTLAMRISVYMVQNFDDYMEEKRGQQG